MKTEENRLEKKLLKEVISYFGDDENRIHHAQRVLKYARELWDKEGGDRSVIIAAAILHDIGIKECERKYHSTNGQLQEKEGPPIARGILENLQIDEETINETCQIIGSHHSPNELNSLNFKIIWDADWLVNLKDEYNIRDKKKLKNIIDKIFLTETGKTKAKEIYIENEKW